MTAEKTTWDLLEPILAGISKTIIIDSAITVATDKYRLFIKKTKWLTYGYTITINNNAYIIIDLQPNEWIEVTGSVPLAAIQAAYNLLFVANPVDGETVVFGEGTFDSTIIFSDSPGANTLDESPVNVQIGATNLITAQNLVAALTTYVSNTILSSVTQSGNSITVSIGTILLGTVGNTFVPVSHTSAITASQTIQGIDAPVLTSFEAYAPYLSHGTVIVKKNELASQNISTDKYPMIWLHEVVPERFNDNRKNTLDRESDCNIYFMIDSVPGWKNNDHYRYAIKPMRNLLALVIEALRKSCSVQLFTFYDVFDAPNWGKYEDSKGMTKKVFGDNLSGTQLIITIPFNKDC